MSQEFQSLYFGDFRFIFLGANKSNSEQLLLLA